MFHGLISDPIAVVAAILPTVVACSVGHPLGSGSVDLRLGFGSDSVAGSGPVVGFENLQIALHQLLVHGFTWLTIQSIGSSYCVCPAKRPRNGEPSLGGYAELCIKG